MVHPRRASEPIFADDLRIQVECKACFAPRFIGDVGPHDAEPPSLPVAATVERRPGAYNAKRNLAERLKAGYVRRGTPSALVILPSSPTVVFLSRRDPGGGAAEVSGSTASVSSRQALRPRPRRSSLASPDCCRLLIGRPRRRSGRFRVHGRHSATLSIAATISALAPCSLISRFAARHMVGDRPRSRLRRFISHRSSSSRKGLSCFSRYPRPSAELSFSRQSPTRKCACCRSGVRMS